MEVFSFLFFFSSWKQSVCLARPVFLFFSFFLFGNLFKGKQGVVATPRFVSDKWNEIIRRDFRARVYIISLTVTNLWRNFLTVDRSPLFRYQVFSFFSFFFELHVIPLEGTLKLDFVAYQLFARKYHMNIALDTCCN